MMGFKALATSVVLGLFAATMMACQAAPAVPAEEATPTAHVGEATPGNAEVAETPTQPPAATLEPTRTPVPPVPTNTPATLELNPTPMPLERVDAVADLPWQKDGLTEDETAALRSLEFIERDHPDLVKTILGYPWVVDDVTMDEQLALRALRTILARLKDSFPEDMEVVVKLDALSDGITWEERLTIQEIATLGDHSTIRASIITMRNRPPAPLPPRLHFEWSQGELTYRHLSALRTLEEIKGASPELYGIVLEYPWLNDEIGPGNLGRLYALSILNSVARIPPLAAAVPQITWLSDPDLTGEELRVLQFMVVFYNEIPELAPMVLGLPWLNEGLTHTKVQALSDILSAARTAPERATQFLSVQFEEDVTSELSGHVLYTLTYLCIGEYEGLDWCEEALTQDWLQDGLTKEEAAKVVALNSLLDNDSDFIELAQEGDVLFESRTLPSVGEVEMFLVSPTPLQPADRVIFDEISVGVQEIDAFMEGPWPNSTVIVVMNTGKRFLGSAVGRNHGTHMELMLGTGTEDLKRVVYHELAHFFTTADPQWLSEGTAEFLASYTLYSREGLNLQDEYDYTQRGIEELCHPEGVTNIQELTEKTARIEMELGIPAQITTLWPCHFPMGESFLLKMHELLGNDAISAALQVLYPLDDDSVAPPEYLIFDALYSRTPPEKREEFLDLYRQLHGPITDRWLQ